MEIADATARSVEELLGDKIICSTCGATLEEYADKCDAPLDKPCMGFLTVEGAIQHIARKTRP